MSSPLLGIICTAQTDTPSSDAARDEWSAERWSLQCQVHIRSFSGVVCIQYRGLLGLSRTQVCVKDAIASLQKRHVHAVRAGVLEMEVAGVVSRHPNNYTANGRGIAHSDDYDDQGDKDDGLRTLM